MTTELEKVERKAAEIVRNSEQKEARKWEAKGKSTMTKWLSSVQASATGAIERRIRTAIKTEAELFKS
jgi:hypothetical protein